MILNFSDFVNESDEQFQISKSLLKNSKINNNKWMKKIKEY